MGTQGGIPVTIDINITDKYYRFRGINLNFGFFWKINQYLTLGGVAKTPFEATIRHEYRFTSKSTLATIPVPTVTTNEISVLEDIELDMPFSYGMGLAIRISDAISFGLDVYRTEWSDYILTDGQGNKFSPIDARTEDSSDVDATTQIRFGGEYLFIRRDFAVPLRGGFFMILSHRMDRRKISMVLALVLVWCIKRSVLMLHINIDGLKVLIQATLFQARRGILTTNLFLPRL